MKLCFLFFIFTITYHVTEAIRTSNTNIKQWELNFTRLWKKESNRQNRKKSISESVFLFVNNANPLTIIRDKKEKVYPGRIFFNSKTNEYILYNVNKKFRLVKSQCLTTLFAKKKGVGSTKNGRDSNPKNLGVKILGNNFAYPGNIIVRQRGRTFKAGYGVKEGRDFTLVATKPGKVHFFKGVVSIVDVSEPRRLTFQDIYEENPTVISLSKMWVGS